MAEAARDLQAQDDPDATYTTAAALAVLNVPGCDQAGLTLVHARRRVESKGASHEGAVAADRLQNELGEGPCLDAVWEQPVVHSPDLAHDPRWPTWGPNVVEAAGLNSILSFRLFTHEGTLGALNMYATRHDGFDDADRSEGLTIAAHVAIAVAAAQKINHLGVALDSRTLTGQASGILMERFGIDADVAFAVLTRIATAEERKLRDLAQELVLTGRLAGVSRGGDAPAAT